MLRRSGDSEHYSLPISMGILIIVIMIISYVSVYPSSNIDSESPEYAIYFPWGTSYQKSYNSVIQAGGIPVRSGTFDFVIVATSSDENFQYNVKQHGALFITSALIKGNCFTNDESRFSDERRI